MYENFSRDDVIDFKIIKSKYAAPIPDIKTINNLPKLKSPLDNFWHGGLEFIYPEDRGVGNSIEISENYLTTSSYVETTRKCSFKRRPKVIIKIYFKN